MGRLEGGEGWGGVVGRGAEGGGGLKEVGRKGGAETVASSEQTPPLA